MAVGRHPVPEARRRCSRFALWRRRHPSPESSSQVLMPQRAQMPPMQQHSASHTERCAGKSEGETVHGHSPSGRGEGRDDDEETKHQEEEEWRAQSQRRGSRPCPAVDGRRGRPGRQVGPGRRCAQGPAPHSAAGVGVSRGNKWKITQVMSSTTLPPNSRIHNLHAISAIASAA